jgi:hypothetical protein
VSQFTLATLSMFAAVSIVFLHMPQLPLIFTVSVVLFFICALAKVTDSNRVIAINNFFIEFIVFIILNELILKHDRSIANTAISENESD